MLVEQLRRDPRALGPRDDREPQPAARRRGPARARRRDARLHRAGDHARADRVVARRGERARRAARARRPARGRSGTRATPWQAGSIPRVARAAAGGAHHRGRGRPALAARPRGGGRAGDVVTAGAFFDLDKTLIEGSSAIHFGRAAYRHGLMTRTQLARDLWANVQFRLKGSTDAGSEALRAADPRRDRGHARARPRAARPRGARRRAPARVPRGAARGLRAPGRRPARLHRDGRLAGDGRADGARPLLRRRHRHALGGARRRLHGRARRPVHLPRGEGRGDPRAGGGGGDRPRGVLRLLGLRVGPADAARRRPPGRRQPGRRARADRARRGLADHALRQARPAAADRGGRRRDRARRRRRRLPGRRAARAQQAPL